MYFCACYSFLIVLRKCYWGEKDNKKQYSKNQKMTIDDAFKYLKQFVFNFILSKSIKPQIYILSVKETEKHYDKYNKKTQFMTYLWCPGQGINWIHIHCYKLLGASHMVAGQDCEVQNYWSDHALVGHYLFHLVSDHWNQCLGLQRNQ